MTPILRIGLLGAGRIAPQAVILPAHLRSDVAVTCVAARDPERARMFADQYAIPEAAESYAALIGRDDIDLVYNALPASLHERWSVAALEAGKAVLCEKPFARTVDEAARMVETARRCRIPLIEAFHYRFHPLMQRMVEVVRSGILGDITGGSAHFEGFVPRRDGELRWDAERGGGALMDLGCYPVHALRTLLGGVPQVSAAAAEWIGDVDAASRATLLFPGGAVCEMRCSMTAPALDSGIELRGTRGRLRASNFVLPHRGATLTLETRGSVRALPIVGPSTYDAQLDHVIGVLRGAVDQITGGLDAVRNLRLIEAIRRATPPPRARECAAGSPADGP